MGTPIQGVTPPDLFLLADSAQQLGSPIERRRRDADFAPSPATQQSPAFEIQQQRPGTPVPQLVPPAGPFNRDTDWFFAQPVNLPGGAQVNTRFAPVFSSDQPPTAPDGDSAGGVRGLPGVRPQLVEATVPLARVSDAQFSAQANVFARLFATPDQLARYGFNGQLRIGAPQAQLSLSGALYEQQPVQSIGQDDGQSRTRLEAGAGLVLGDVSIGLNVTRESGAAVPSPTTRLDVPLGVNVGGTTIRAIASVTETQGQGRTNQAVGLAVSPTKPDETRPSVGAGVVLGDNPQTDRSAYFSVFGIYRF